MAGNLLSLSAASSSPDLSSTISSYAAKNPGKVRTEPFALKIAAPPVFVSTSKSTRICIFLASDI